MEYYNDHNRINSSLISVGSGTSFTVNIKSLYPNSYKDLSIDDFAIVCTSISSSGNICSCNRASNNKEITKQNFSKNYNATTGVLSITGAQVTITSVHDFNESDKYTCCVYNMVSFYVAYLIR